MRDDLEPDLDLDRALAGLRAAVAGAVKPPAAPAIRAHVEHQTGVRRTVRVLAVAGAVVAIATASAVLAGAPAPRPVPPPAVTPSPTSTPPPSVTPTQTPTASASASPASADPITRVDWRTAKIKIPTEPGCPSGAIQLRARDEGIPSAYGPTGYPRVSFDLTRIGYGDVTGDGRLEAILDGGCFMNAEDSGDGKGRLLVVTRRTDGTLTGLGWVGVPGAIFAGYWVAGDVVFVDERPWHQDWGYRLGAVSGHRYENGGFTQVDTTVSYPPLTAGRVEGPAIDLTTVADRSGCPAAVLRFDNRWRASGAGTTWDVIQPEAPDGSTHLVDLDGDGNRRLLVAVTCGRPVDGVGGVSFLAVLEQADGGYRAIEALRPPAGMTLGGWQFAAGTLTVSVAPDGGGEVVTREYRWTGGRLRG